MRIPPSHSRMSNVIVWRPINESFLQVNRSTFFHRPSLICEHTEQVLQVCKNVCPEGTLTKDFEDEATKKQDNSLRV